MSTAEALTAYGQISSIVFSAKKFFLQDGGFKATVLENAVQKIIMKYGEHHNKQEEILDLRHGSNGGKTCVWINDQWDWLPVITLIV